MNQSPWYSVLAIFISMVVMGVLGFFYTSHVDREQDQQFCIIFVYLDDGYRSSPPTTLAGKEFARRIHVLRESLDCE